MLRSHRLRKRRLGLTKLLQTPKVALFLRPSLRSLSALERLGRQFFFFFWGGVEMGMTWGSTNVELRNGTGDNKLELTLSSWKHQDDCVGPQCVSEPCLRLPHNLLRGRKWMKMGCYALEHELPKPTNLLAKGQRKHVHCKVAFISFLRLLIVVKNMQNGSCFHRRTSRLHCIGSFSCEVAFSCTMITELSSQTHLTWFCLFSSNYQ